MKKIASAFIIGLMLATIACAQDDEDSGRGNSALQMLNNFNHVLKSSNAAQQCNNDCTRELHQCQNSCASGSASRNLLQQCLNDCNRSLGSCSSNCM